MIPTALTPTLMATGNLAAQRREAVLKSIPTLAVDAVDTYTAGLTSFTPLSSHTAELLCGGSVGLAGLHLVLGGMALRRSTHTSDASLKLREQCLGYGQVITSLGFVALAAGMGPWSLPLIGVGLATTNYAKFA